MRSCRIVGGRATDYESEDAVLQRVERSRLRRGGEPRAYQAVRRRDHDATETISAYPRSTVAVGVYELSAAYDGPPVLEDVSFELARGELVIILGPNGAGKSTLFKILTGLKTASSGRISVLGHSIGAARAEGCIAYVPQEEHIDWQFPISVWDVVFTGRYGLLRNEGGVKRFLPARWARREDREAVAAALNAVAMYEYRDRPIGALSGGQKKRVFLARALAQEAAVLLLDEPLAGVDRRSEDLIFDVLQRAKAEGRTLLMVTHDLQSAEEHGDRLLLLNRSVIALGSPDEVLSHDNLLQMFHGAAPLRRHAQVSTQV